MIGGVTRRELPNLPGVSTSMSTGPWRYKYNESMVSGQVFIQPYFTTLDLNFEEVASGVLHSITILTIELAYF